MDVIVVGGGIIGCSVAWRLARLGFSVSIHERGTLGCEATWASAGMLAPGGEYTSDSQWTRLAIESHRLYPDFVAELTAASGVQIDYRRCGAIEAAYTQAEWQALQERSLAQNGLGIRAEHASGDQLHLFNHAVSGAMYYPDEAAVDPRHLVAALREACTRAGVTIQESIEVKTIRPFNGGVQVETPDSFIEARTAVLAAGAWSSAFGYGAAVLPAGGHLTGYYLQPGVIGPILRHGHTYILQRSNGFTIAGATEERIGFARGVNPECIADIRARAAQLCPLFGGLVPDVEWSGLRPATDSGPEVQREPGTSIWLSYGHYRNGILLAPITAKIVTAEISAFLEGR